MALLCIQFQYRSAMIDNGKSISMCSDGRCSIDHTSIDVKHAALYLELILLVLRRNDAAPACPVTRILMTCL